MDAWSDCKKNENKVLGRKSYGVSMRDVANAMPNSVNIHACPNTTRFRLHTKKPGAKICTVGELSSAQTFVHPPFLQDGLRGGSHNQGGSAGRWAIEAPLRQNFQPSKPDVQGSVLDNTYAVEIISKKSIYSKGIEKWKEK